MMKYKADLHIHSCYSDGSATIEEIVALVRDSEINVFSISDHDNMEGIKKALELTKDMKVQFIPGIEISSLYENGYEHILGYHCAVEDAGIKKICNQNITAFEKKDEKFVENLIDEGYPLDLGEYRSFTYNSRNGGWKVLNYIIEKEIIDDIYGFLNTYQPGGVLPFAQLVSPETAIKQIHKAGGLAVLAHPGSYVKTEEELNQLLKRYMENGIDGIECYTFKNSENVKDTCIQFCLKNNLMITGGSDYHGRFARKRQDGLTKWNERELKIDKLLDRFLSV